MAKILYVEDIATVRKLNALVLTGAGHEVAEAKDLAEARTKFGADKFDLILTDWQYPGVSPGKMDGGYQLVKSIRNGTRNANTPILILSSSVDVVGEVRLREPALFKGIEVISKSDGANALKRKVAELTAPAASGGGPQPPGGTRSSPLYYTPMM